MTKHTVRDDVWDQALQYAVSDESFKLREIQAGISRDLSDRTIRDTLNTMVDHGWLSKRTVRSHRWLPGPKTKDEDTSSEKRDTDKNSTEEVYTDERVASVDSLTENTVYCGLVDRISNSDNGIISEVPSKSHINLGPISHAAVGNVVRFEYLGGLHGKCLDSEYTGPEYESRIEKRIAERTREDRVTSSGLSDDWDDRRRNLLSDMSGTYD